jgi:hypothetical protein
MSEHTNLGRYLALAVGLGALVGAGVTAATTSDRVSVVILVLIGGGALSGWAKARRSR